MTEDAKNIYCARLPGWPGFVAVMVDDSDDKASKKFVADGLRDWVKAGYEIAGKFTRAESVVGLQEFSAEKKRRDAENPPPEQPAKPAFAIACRGKSTRGDQERERYERAMRGEL